MKYPITFEHNGKTYQGTLEQVMGARSGAVYHLYAENFYWGRLRKVNTSWVFDATPKAMELEGMAEAFGETVEIRTTTGH